MKRSIIVPILIAAVALLALLSYLFIDDRVFFDLAGGRPDIYSVSWIDAFRQIGKAWVPIWLLLIFLYTTRRVRPALAGVLALLLIVPIVQPAKFLFARPRPETRMTTLGLTDEDNPFERTSSSFPSGDTATAFAVAAALTPYAAAASTRVAFTVIPLLFSGAVFIGVLRVLTMKHYVSDAMGGAVVGILAGYLAWLIIQRHPNLRPHIYISRTGRIVTLVLILLLPLLPSLVENVNPLVIFIKDFWALILLATMTAAMLHRQSRVAEDDHNGPEA